MRIYTSEQMRAAEQLAADGGTTFLSLMECAGSACAKIISDKFLRDASTKRVVIVCGKGKNGGDGFVIARRLFEAGVDVRVVLAMGAPVAADAVKMCSRLDGLSIEIIDYTLCVHDALAAIHDSCFIVDAVFGIGFSGSADEALSRLFREMSGAEAAVIAVDTPSGVCSDSAQVCGECVRATATVAISAYKPLHVLYPARQFCGELFVAEIGAENDFYTAADYDAYTYTGDEIKCLMPERAHISNKGDYGKVLCICGSMNYAGAAVLSAMGAVRSGAGLVLAAFPRCAYPAIGAKLTEPVLLPMPSNEQGTFSAAAIPLIVERLKDCSAVLIGCGLGLNADTRELVAAVLENAKCPVIVDADGINALADNIDILNRTQAPVTLTPHPGEMSRLTGKSIAQILADTSRAAKDFADEYGVTLVLKGANTVIARAGERALYVNATGNSGMAKGGSGDFLSGITVGFAAQGVRDAAAAAVYVHGLCGDAAAKRLSQRGMTPCDCIDELAQVLAEFE